MDYLITHEGGQEFRFPCEIILGRIPALHPMDEFERHVREVAEARKECIEYNKQFPQKPNNQNHETKTKYEQYYPKYSPRHP